MTRNAPRSPNPRGSGDRLRDDIVGAARSLLATERTASAVTLRGVARAIGIAAPSIYAHFAGTGAIVEAVVLQALDELDGALSRANAAGGEPPERLLGLCRVWIAFGANEPALYALLFEDESRAGAEWPARSRLENERRAVIFGRLVRAVQDCVDDGSSAAESAFDAAMEVWVAMHGLITLRGARDRPPWPPRDAMERSIVVALARIRTPRPPSGEPHAE